MKHSGLKNTSKHGGSLLRMVMKTEISGILMVLQPTYLKLSIATQNSLTEQIALNIIQIVNGGAAKRVAKQKLSIEHFMYTYLYKRKK